MSHRFNDTSKLQIPKKKTREMEEFSNWICSRTVLFTSNFGMTHQTFDLSENIFSISILVSIFAVHFTLHFLAANSDHPASQIANFHSVAHNEREKILGKTMSHIHDES